MINYVDYHSVKSDNEYILDNILKKTVVKL